MKLDIYIFAAASTSILIGIIVAIWLGFKNGFLDFLKKAHWISLLLLILAGVLTWISMVWMVNPNKFKILPKQWVSLGFSVGISVLWWARYAYTVASLSPDVEEI